MRVGIFLLIFINFVFGGINTSSIVMKPLTKRVESSDIKYVSFDIDTLKKRIPIEIKLSDSKTIHLNLSRFESDKNGFTWVGKSPDGKSSAIFTVYKDSLVGTINTKDSQYRVASQNGNYKLIKIDPDTAIKIDHHGIKIPHKKEIMLPSSKNKKFKKKQIQYQASTTSGNSDVYVLLYYTKELYAEYGSNTVTNIKHVFDVAKQAYIDSNTNVRLRLIGIKKVEDGSYLQQQASNDQSVTNMLSALSKDGVIKYERMKLNADAVTVFGKDSNNGMCGLAQTPYDSSDTFRGAFSAVVLHPSSGSGSYCPDISYAHELGHNFGCHHDDDHDNNSDHIITPYAHGYDISGEFATIMSYDTPKIKYFSNPNINWSGDNATAIGDSSTADNARVIREERFKIAGNDSEYDESLEGGDTLTGSDMSGSFASETDRDGFRVYLGGSTTFSAPGGWAYFLNLYNEDTHKFIGSFNSDSSINLSNGCYRVVMAKYSDNDGTYYSGSNTSYGVDYSTNASGACSAEESVSAGVLGEGAGSSSGSLDGSSGGSGGGCVYNPNGSLDALIAVMLLAAFVYPLRKRFLG